MFMQIVPRFLPFFLFILIGCSLAWQGVTWNRLLHSPPGAPTSVTAEQPVAQSLDNLLPLFADSQPNSGANPATNLQWVLLGSFAHADAQQSSALIQDEQAKAKRYRVGEQLAPGIRLHAVYPDRVELLRNGRVETLPFKRTPQHDGRNSDLADSTNGEVPGEQALPGLDPEQLQRELESLSEQLQPEEGAPQPDETSMEGSQ